LKRLSLEEVKQEFISKKYIPLFDEYKSSRELLLYECLKHPGIQQKIRLQDLKRTEGCRFCATERRKEIRKIPLDVVKQEFINRGYIPLFNIYYNNREKLLAQTKEGYKFEVPLTSLKANHPPHIVDKHNSYSIENIKLWLKVNKKPFKLISDEYERNDLKLKWKCLKKNCGEIFEMTWCNVISDFGCNYCTGKKVGLSNCLATKNPELASEWHPTNNGDLTPYDVTCGCEKFVWWKCKDCNHEWKTMVNSRNKTGCPKCNISKGENEIEKYLIKNDIVYQVQFKMKNCKNVLPLAFDFAIFNNDQLYGVIEFDGRHHFEADDFFGGNKEFEYIKLRDSIKNKYCQDNNIPLLRIPYWDFDNVGRILNDFLLFKNNQIDTKQDNIVNF